MPRTEGNLFAPARHQKPTTTNMHTAAWLTLSTTAPLSIPLYLTSGRFSPSAVCPLSALVHRLLLLTAQPNRLSIRSPFSLSHLNHRPAPVMSRALLALPVAAAASLSVYRASANNTPAAKLSDIPATAVTTVPSMAEATTATASATAPGRAQPQQGTAPKRRTMPARFQLEDEEELKKALHGSQPRIGDATLQSGLGVEIATW